MSLETSRPRRGLCGYPIDAALVTRRSQRNEPEIAMDPGPRAPEILGRRSGIFCGHVWFRSDAGRVEVSPGSHSSVLGRRCARDQMMV